MGRTYANRRQVAIANQGDSDGPLVVKNANGQAVQIGVVRWGEWRRGTCEGGNWYGSDCAAKALARPHRQRRLCHVADPHGRWWTK